MYGFGTKKLEVAFNELLDACLDKLGAEQTECILRRAGLNDRNLNELGFDVDVED